MQDQLRFEIVVEFLPPDCQAALAGDEVEPTLGMGGALIFRVLDSAGGCKYLKIASGLGAQLLAQHLVLIVAAWEQVPAGVRRHGDLGVSEALLSGLERAALIRRRPSD
jgi:hypothetical protein